MTTQGWGFFVVSEPNFDDEDLEEIQTLLWRGYTPEPYPRHDWYVYPLITGNNWHPPLRRTRRFTRKDEPPKAEVKHRPKISKMRIVPKYSRFQCDLCQQWFRSVANEEEAEEAYRETFGPTASEERLALCEACYDRAMEGLLNR